MSSPLFQSPQSFQSNKLIAENNPTFQPEKNISNQQVASEQPPVDSKFMTIQQVINLITTRLITVENFINDFDNKPKPVFQGNSAVSGNLDSGSVNVDYSKIEEICRSLVEEHISEFDHRYAILAEEISNLKHIILNLQSYTMEVNKVLMEERLSKMVLTNEETNEVTNEDANEETNELTNEETNEETNEVTNEVTNEETNEATNEVTNEVEKEEDVPNIDFQFEPEQDVNTEETKEESDLFSINIVPKKEKKANKQRNGDK
jgi:hypothetical protein